jgi:DNA topoisomerase-1
LNQELNNTVFVITEKPDAALRIASALDVKEKPRKMLDHGVPYYIAKRDKEIIVVPSLGHLYTITDAQKGRHLPAFAFKWVPRHVAERKAARIRSWVQTIEKLAKNADIFIDACDYDVEGSIIGYFILKYACGNKEESAQRMKYSTLTNEELKKSFAELQPSLDFRLIEAGRARHEIDWLYGINLSRSLTNAAKGWSGRYVTLSTGRVQGPTLRFLVKREETIKAFVPTQYWQIRAKVEMHRRIFEADYEKERLENLEDAESVLNGCKNKTGRVEAVEVRKTILLPPFPFNLTTLQTEAYALFHYAPSSVSNIAQQLYLKALISYPRTDSQKLPPIINYRAILKSLNRLNEYRKMTSELLAQEILRPNEGKKDDSAHSAIYPTGELPQRDISKSEAKILDLIVRRFISVFGEPALKQSMKVHLSAGRYHFRLNGKTLLKKGWMRYYEPYIRFEEVTLPPIEKGELIKIKKIVLRNLTTEPPPRYNPVSLLKEMEEAGIGTKATRTETIQTLYDRGYIKGERMIVTALGFEIIEILERYCPSIVSTELTRELETEMNSILEGIEERQKVLTHVVGILEPVVDALKKEEKRIGERLSSAVQKAEFEERTIGACPVCKTGKLVLIHSRATRKRFVGCTNYFKGSCHTSFPLPQKGALRLQGKKCVKCGWPIVETWTRGRFRTLCFNQECTSRKVFC